MQDFKKLKGPLLRFLGSGTTIGVPAFFCDCQACQEATAEPKYARGGSSLLIQNKKNILIDTAQELRLQLLHANVNNIDAIIYSHEHNDHVAGLGVLEYYVRIVRKSPLPVYASAQVIRYLQAHFDFMCDCLSFNEIKPFEDFVVDELNYTPLPASHNEGCLGFMFSIPQGQRIAYFPDSAKLPQESEARVRGSDIIIFDATFNGDNWMPKEHMNIDGVSDYLQELDCQQGILTHLAMSYDRPITATDLNAKLEKRPMTLKQAYDGMQISLLV